MGIYSHLLNTEPEEWMEYGALTALIVFSIAVLLRPSWLFLVGIGVSAIVIYFRMDRHDTVLAAKNEELETRLKELRPQPQNFHMDADLINLFWNIKEFQKYNSEAYNNAMIAVDNMLKLKAEMEIGVYHCAENLDVARDQVTEAMNQMQSVIIKLPLPKPLVRKHQRALNALHILLRRHIDDMVRMCQKQYAGRGMNVDTKFVYNKGPRPDDTKRQEYDSMFALYV